MRVPRKIKKAVKYVERYSQPSASEFGIIPYEEFVIKGRRTKWKLKCLNEVKRELRRQLVEEWCHFNDTILVH